MSRQKNEKHRTWQLILCAFIGYRLKFYRTQTFSYPTSMQIGFLKISWVNLLDILFVAVLLFNLYKLLRGSGALKVFFGYISLYLLYLVVKATGMELFTAILGQFMGVGVLAAIILFQQEIRKFLQLIGQTTEFRDLNFMALLKGKKKSEKLNLTPLIEALKTLANSNTGALIVVSRYDDLQFFADTGDILDARLSKRLLLSIFYKNSPLHDGAAILYKGRVLAARCVLPVSESEHIPARFGLRHRAAVGITEQRDVAVLVASEETGQISLVRKGEIFRNLSTIEVRRKLNEYLTGSRIEVAPKNTRAKTA